MTAKKSAESVRPHRKLGDGLNYTFDYEYDSENYAHRLLRAGDRRYEYDANGNIVLEHDGENADAGDGGRSHKINVEADNVYSTDYGWGLFRDTRNGMAKNAKYRRYYTWNEKNQLVSSSDAQYTINYVYGQDGQRAAKYTAQSEALYFNKMWSHHTDGGNAYLGGHNIKNIYLGETRIVTKLAAGHETTVHEEVYKQFFYHSDHLGSAALITDYRGDEYQRLEYTPYGEIWVEEQRVKNEALVYLPYKFTGKERDEETGLYYYGARYLDPKYSRWISVDPALGEYVPGAGKSNEADKLPGMGGLFNSVNGNLYHYAANNPVRYTDPTGMAAYDEFDSMDAAAKDWAKTYADDSIVQGNEMGSSIFMMVKDGKVKFFYNIPYEGTLIENPEEKILRKTCDINRNIDEGYEKEGATVFVVSAIHSHANWDPRFNDENPSKMDKEGVESDSSTYRFYARREYVVTPGGYLKEFDKNGVTRIVSSSILRDIRQDIPKKLKQSIGYDAFINAWATKIYHEDEYYPY